MMPMIDAGCAVLIKGTHCDEVRVNPEAEIAVKRYALPNSPVRYAVELMEGESSLDITISAKQFRALKKALRET